MKTNEIKIIRRKDLIKMIGISRSTIYRLEESGEFPKRIQLSKNSVGWYLDQIQEWLENRKVVHKTKDNTI